MSGKVKMFPVLMDYDCGWVQKNGSCSLYNGMDVPCTAHTYAEAQTFFQKKFDAEKKATR